MFRRGGCGDCEVAVALDALRSCQCLELRPGGLAAIPATFLELQTTKVIAVNSKLRLRSCACRSATQERQAPTNLHHTQ